MATQAALITDTIMGIKRALRKEDDYSGPDDAIAYSTNRGNKLRENARYVREGVLGYAHAEELYKQKVEHAGYTRYILQRNPTRYDSEGDELDDEDEDSEADAAAAEGNPFAEIALENLLCPLKHPSELPTHPSLSHAYLSTSLVTMTQNIEAKLRQERALLWRARNLHRQFLGDSNWMPCGMVESPEDPWIFAPFAADPAQSSLASQSGHSGAVTPSTARKDVVVGAAAHEEPVPEQASHDAWHEDTAARPAEVDAEMMDAPGIDDASNDAVERIAANNFKSEDMETSSSEFVPRKASVAFSRAGAQTNGESWNEKSMQVGALGMRNDVKNDDDDEGGLNGGAAPPKNGQAFLPLQSADGQAAEQQDDRERDGDHDGKELQDRDEATSTTRQSTPEQPRRMTTRAQANAATTTNQRSPSPAISEAASSIPPPHPLFLIPDSVRANVNFGLPPNEADETRRLLWSYIQKQEETVRGFEHMLDSLLKACRMREDVLDWCKAEGHLGEMSDGEDWYDCEKWGLAEGEDLKKGADEDEVEAVDDGRATGKRGRGRRA